MSSSFLPDPTKFMEGRAMLSAEVLSEKGPAAERKLTTRRAGETSVDLVKPQAVSNAG